MSREWRTRCLLLLPRVLTSLPRRPAQELHQPLADGMRLTATEIEQLRQVPELVFVNCCHLGVRPETGEQPADLRDDTRHLHQLAASLGVALIEMGVKVVVVAGWAVDDAAAATFAVAFYQSLLNGEPFGEAVKWARRECYRRHPTHNTWGAYQCYGDPAYRLCATEQSGAGADPPDWTAPVRVVQQLENLRSRARTGSAVDRLADEIAAIDDKITRDYPHWLWNGRVREALGRAWAELAGLTSWTDPSTPGPDPTTPFAKALEHLDAALGCDDSPGTLQLRGDLANLRVRAETVAWRTAWRALDQRRAQLAVGARRATLQSNTARDLTALLAELEQDLEPWATPRRWTRVGSAAKRLAAVFPGAGRTYLVQEAIDAYAEANRLARERCGEDDPYPAFNWILLRTLAHLADGRRGLDGVAPVLERLEAAGDDSTYWERLLPVQTRLARELGEIYRLHEDSGLSGAALRQAVTPAARAIGREAEGASRTMRSHYQLALYLESLDTLIDLTDDRWQTSQAGNDRLAAARHMFQHLRAEIARQAEAIRDR